MHKKPKVLETKEVARSRLFCVEELHLEFSNGAKRIYERLKAGGAGAVMVVAINDDECVVAIRNNVGCFTFASSLSEHDPTNTTSNKQTHTWNSRMA